MVEWDGTVCSTTSRLRLRTFRPDDLPLYAALNADPVVMEFLGGQPLSREDSDAIAEYAQGLHAREGIGLLAVERAEDGVFLGMCGLHHVTDWYPRHRGRLAAGPQALGARLRRPRRPPPGSGTASRPSTCRGSSRSPTATRRTSAAWR